jgi:hypothetical protein
MNSGERSHNFSPHSTPAATFARGLIINIPLNQAIAFWGRAIAGFIIMAILLLLISLIVVALVFLGMVSLGVGG